MCAIDNERQVEGLPTPLVPPRKTATGRYFGAAARLAARTTDRDGMARAVKHEWSVSSNPETSVKCAFIRTVWCGTRGRQGGGGGGCKIRASYMT